MIETRLSIGGLPLRAFAGGALQGADNGFVAGGNPPEGAAEDGRQRTIAAFIARS
jgi:hypothetical protein